MTNGRKDETMYCCKCGRRLGTLDCAYEVPVRTGGFGPSDGRRMCQYCHSDYVAYTNRHDGEGRTSYNMWEW